MVQLLTHLPKDLRRIGPALNFETEKGEQFNKHIREHLFHTNRRDTSKIVCLKFAKQSIMRHVIDGGSWLNKDNLREKQGEYVTKFLEQNSKEKFRHMLLEVQEI